MNWLLIILQAWAAATITLTWLFNRLAFIDLAKVQVYNFIPTIIFIWHVNEHPTLHILNAQAYSVILSTYDFNRVIVLITVPNFIMGMVLSCLLSGEDHNVGLWYREWANACNQLLLQWASVNHNDASYVIWWRLYCMACCLLISNKFL